MRRGYWIHRLLGIALLAILVGVPARAGGNKRWTWKLPKEQYKGLNMFERAQYDKAERLFDEKSYKAAASEFEKFKVQFGDSTIIPYIVFMRALSLHSARDRHKAIKVYNEVLDYFADEIWVAAPAIYYLGQAHFDNGDTREALKVWQEMVEDPDYVKHPLAAGALRHLADNHWKNKEQDKAIEYYKKVCGFWEVNPEEARNAFDKVVRYYIAKGDYGGYESWRLTKDTRNDPKRRAQIARDLIDRAADVFHTRSGYYTEYTKKKLSQDTEAFLRYYYSQKPWFDKAKDLWNYYSKGVWFHIHRYRDKTLMPPFIEEAFAYVKATKDKKKKNDRFAWLCDRLREGHQWTMAFHCIGMMTDRPYAAYKEYEVMGHGQGKWKEAAAKLEDLEKSGGAYWAKRAKETRAWVYKDRLGKYQEAIKLYQEIDNPPNTLWAIQDCYSRWGKLKEALATLTEIESSFPDHAPNASWQKACYLDRAGERKQAIAEARKILKRYKKSRAASEAHQLLEKYNVLTGGGVFKEE